MGGPAWHVAKQLSRDGIYGGEKHRNDHLLTPTGTDGRRLLPVTKKRTVAVCMHETAGDLLL